MKVKSSKIEMYRENADGTRTPGTARVLQGVYDETFFQVDDFRDEAGEPMERGDGDTFFLVYHSTEDE